MITDAQVQNVRTSEVEPGQGAVIMGWGAQDNSNHSDPTRNFKALITYTIECPAHFGGGQSYHFICIGARRNIGGPCIGDEGGVPLCLHCLYCTDLCTLVVL